MDPSTTPKYSDDPEFNGAVIRLARSRGLEVTYDHEGRPLIVTVDEGELYQVVADAVGARRSNPPVTAARTVSALEALAELRWTALERELAEDLTALADKLRARLADAVHALAGTGVESGQAAATTVLELAQAHRELIGLARAEQADKVESSSTRHTYLRILDAATTLCDVAAEHTRDEFEGRLDDLLKPLEVLAATIGHPIARDFGTVVA